MINYKLLFLDDEESEYEMILEDAEEINEHGEYQVEIYHAKNSKEAYYMLYTERIDGVILDLLLEGGGEAQKNDEDLGGNIFLNNLLNKDILPVIVRTNTPGRVLAYEKDTKNLITTYAKTDSSYEMLQQLIKEIDSAKFKLLGRSGELSQGITEIFWKSLPQDIDSWEVNKGVAIRYVSSWLKNNYDYDTDLQDFSKQSPREVYMFPNLTPKLCTGDILEKDGLHYVVLTPACDLANRKCEKVLLVKIISDHSVLSSPTKFRNALRKAKTGENTSEFAEFTRHKSKNRYHFLPKVPDFNGGVMDFQDVVTVEYIPQERDIKSELGYKRVGVITDAFIRDIIARFGMYYQRQGQPDLDIDEVIKYFDID